MKYIFVFLISQSVLLPIIAGLIRLRRIDKSYRPFLLLLLIGLLTEIVSLFFIKYTGANTIPINVYTLIEWTFLAWQFHVWGFLRQKKKLFYALLVLATLVWITENLIFKKIHDFSPYFVFFYSFLVVLLSVNEINFMITHYRNLFRNPRFIICIGLIVYFVYMIVYYWAFEISRFGRRSEISDSILFLVAYINGLANIIYAIAFLVIPKPQRFTLS